jgi:hypothetical protein
MKKPREGGVDVRKKNRGSGSQREAVTQREHRPATTSISVAAIGRNTQP